MNVCIRRHNQMEMIRHDRPCHEQPAAKGGRLSKLIENYDSLRLSQQNRLALEEFTSRSAQSCDISIHRGLRDIMTNAWPVAFVHGAHETAFVTGQPSSIVLVAKIEFGLFPGVFEQIVQRRLYAKRLSW
jgi:uncharacterized protein YjiS (DUF1127 family)